MSRVRDPNSTSSRLNFNAPPAWANHVTRVALALGYPNLTAYIVASVNDKLKADGCPYQALLDQPVENPKKRGRKKGE